MTKNRKKWLASVLTLTIALSDCESFSVLAEEETAAPENMESGISENNMFNAEPKLPALHIGQIPEGEKLPDANDDTFIYDLPVSFETAENLILFSNYAIEQMPEDAENGTLEWSILRGEKGLTEGSASILNGEDDWDGFEEVSFSPCFTMEALGDKECEYDRMMVLTPGETVCDEAYDYYIRAAYFEETEEGKAEDFYAAATIPFVPADQDEAEPEAKNAEDTGTISENDMPAIESVSSNDLFPETSVSSDDLFPETSVSSNDLSTEISVSENNTDPVKGKKAVASPADAIPADENIADSIAEQQ